MVGTLVNSRPYITKLWLYNILDHVDDSQIVAIFNNAEEQTIQLFKDIAPRSHMFFDNSIESKHRGQRGRYYNLSILRNKLLDIVFKQLKSDTLFSIDSDVMVVEDIFTPLQDSGKDIISVLIRNDKRSVFYDGGKTESNVMIKDGGYYKHITIPDKGINECDLTGAVYKISKSVYDSGVRYGAHQQGEDCCFCGDAKRKGFSLWYNGDIWLPHLMNKKKVAEYIDRYNHS